MLLMRKNQEFFVNTHIQIWNSCVKLIIKNKIKNKQISDLSVSNLKVMVKKSLLEVQNAHHEIEWYDANYNIETLTKIGKK